jgi:hypothetical protein
MVHAHALVKIPGDTSMSMAAQVDKQPTDELSVQMVVSLKQTGVYCGSRCEADTQGIRWRTTMTDADEMKCDY